MSGGIGGGAKGGSGSSASSGVQSDAGAGGTPPTVATTMLSGLYEYYHTGTVDDHAGGTDTRTRYWFEPGGQFKVCRVSRTVVVPSPASKDVTTVELNKVGTYTLKSGSIQFAYSDGLQDSFSASYDASSMRLQIDGHAYTITTQHADYLCVKPGIP